MGRAQTWLLSIVLPDADDSAKEKARLVERASQSGQGVRKSRGAGFMASVKSRHYEKFDFN
eukprot:5839724-Pleurochrysis_carterae.AAC.1